jgi:hypothetical protein
MDSLKAQVARQREAIIVLQDQLQVLHQRIQAHSARARARAQSFVCLSDCPSARFFFFISHLMRRVYAGACGARGRAG